MREELEFTKRVKEQSDVELVSTFQFVSGLFARKQEKMNPDLPEIARDLNILKHEILDRLKRLRKVEAIKSE